jgi:hypothetical protein
VICVVPIPRMYHLEDTEGFWLGTQDNMRICTNIFGDKFTLACCFFHVTKNVDENRSLLKDKDVWNEVRSDISTLQHARSPEGFNAAKELLISKCPWNGSSVSNLLMITRNLLVLVVIILNSTLVNTLLALQ